MYSYMILKGQDNGCGCGGDWGSFAGLAAGLYLARARKTVVIYDHGLTRNRFAAHGHGFLGMDGLAPDEMRARGRADVLAYPSVELRAEAVQSVARQGDVFVVAGDRPVLARRLVLAYGMRDTLPAIPGLAEGWGVWALQCPYCHGFENADRPTAILMIADGLPHHASLLRDWTGDLTVLTNGFSLGLADRALLRAAGIAVRDGAVVRFHDGIAWLAGGGQVAFGVVYLVARCAPSAPFASDLGCAMTEGPMGPHVTVNEMKQTSQPGIYAAGDLCRPFYGALFAAADGAMAGTACHASLIVPL